VRLSLLLPACLVLGCVGSPSPDTVGRSTAALETWAPAGAMSGPRVFHTASALADGRVLVTGGDGEGVGVLSTTELYDPAKNAWSTGATMTTRRAQHTATTLQDGRVLVIGGRSTADTATSSSTAELFDPKTGTWSAAGAMTLRRVDHTATLLPSGKVLVVGGADEANFHSDAELWDPGSRTFAAAGALSSGRVFHSATLLGTKVVVAAGYEVDPLSTTEIYDATSGAWSAGPALAAVHSEHAAVALDATHLLVIGGFSDPSTFSNVTEVLNVATGTAVKVGPLESPRANGQALLLPSGQALTVCGRDSGGAVGRAELYDTTSERWSSAGPLTGKRDRCAIAPLPGGKVLVTGGVGAIGYYSAAEIYSPAAAAAACTTNGDCASGHCVDGVCCNAACTGACERCDSPGAIGVCGKVSGAKNHCAAGEVCVDDRCIKGAGTRCSADGLSSIDTAEKATACGAYRCRATDGACFQTCGDSSQCAPGYACDPGTSKCAATGSDEDSGGCATRTGRAPSFAAFALLALALATLRSRRR